MSSEVEFCCYFAAGQCRFGSGCRLSHDVASMKSKEQQWLTEKKLTKIVSSCVKQPFDYYVVFDLEGKEEIIEFPAILLDGSTFCEIARFHHFVRPKNLFKDAGSYAANNKESNALSFVAVMREFSAWIEQHCGREKTFVLCCCGNWDAQTQIPKQCEISGIPTPPCFNQWINVKDIFLHHYEREARGMKEMLNKLQIPLDGQHHLGMDDTSNIAKVIARMAQNGARMQITGKRDVENGNAIVYTFAQGIGRRRNKQGFSNGGAAAAQSEDDEYEQEAPKDEDWVF